MKDWTGNSWGYGDEATWPNIPPEDEDTIYDIDRSLFEGKEDEMIDLILGLYDNDHIDEIDNFVDGLIFGE